MCGGAGLRQSVPRAGATCTRAAAAHLVEDEDVGALDLLAHELHHLPSAFPGLGRAEVGALLQLVPLLKLLLLRCGAESVDKPLLIAGTQTQREWPMLWLAKRLPCGCVPPWLRARCSLCTARGARNVDPSTAVTIAWSLVPGMQARRLVRGGNVAGDGGGARAAAGGEWRAAGGRWRAAGSGRLRQHRLVAPLCNSWWRPRASAAAR